jgi:hypothetical protein
MNWYSFFADAIVAIHLAYVAFVVVGLAATWIGIALKKNWARNFWFRAVHLAMIGVVAMESIFGIVCPLTNWESQLRVQGGGTEDPNSFVGRWVHEVLYYDISPSVLTVAYIAFGLAVLLTFFFAPPRWPWRNVRDQKNKAG